jgi:hypothetical protein
METSASNVTSEDFREEEAAPESRSVELEAPVRSLPGGNVNGGGVEGEGEGAVVGVTPERTMRLCTRRASAGRAAEASAREREFQRKAELVVAEDEARRGDIAERGVGEEQRAGKRERGGEGAGYEGGGRRRRIGGGGGRARGGAAGTGSIQARGGVFGQPQRCPALGASQNLWQLRDRHGGEEASWDARREAALRRVAAEGRTAILIFSKAPLDWIASVIAIRVFAYCPSNIYI